MKYYTNHKRKARSEKLLWEYFHFVKDIRCTLGTLVFLSLFNFILTFLLQIKIYNAVIWLLMLSDSRFKTVYWRICWNMKGENKWKVWGSPLHSNHIACHGLKLRFFIHNSRIFHRALGYLRLRNVYTEALCARITFCAL